MQRRQALQLLGAVPLLGRPAKAIIRDVSIWRLDGQRESLAGVDRQHQVQPNHVYEELRPKPYRDAGNARQQEGYSFGV